MFTGISGSYTVRMASSIAGRSAAVFEASGTRAPASLVDAGVSEADSGIMGSGFISSQALGPHPQGYSALRFARAWLGATACLQAPAAGGAGHSVDARDSRSSAAFSVCHARLAHFTRTGNSRTPES